MTIIYRVDDNTGFDDITEYRPAIFNIVGSQVGTRYRYIAHFYRAHYYAGSMILEECW